MLHGQADSVCPCRVGLALGGGAARGFAHIGVIRAFEESGISIDYLAGTSIGALIGAFYAAGRTPDEMLQVALKLKAGRLKPILPFHFRKVGLDYVELLLEQYVVVKTFEELKRPLFVTATNLYTGKNEVFSSGTLYPAIRASAAIPIRFKEQKIDNVVYLDGGFTNNLPVAPLRAQCCTVIGVSINLVDENENRNMGLKQKFLRIANIVFSEIEANDIALCDYHIEISGLEKFGFEDYRRAQEIHDLGYRTAKTFIAEHPELMSKHSAKNAGQEYKN
jgi:NTE family protein